MLDRRDGPLTFIRFGVQRKKGFLRDVQQAYDGLVLPANILLYQYRSTPLAVFMCQRPFFVDPMSYLLGQPYEHFKQRVKQGPRFKPSFHKLMAAHGLPPENFLPYSYTTLLRFLAQSEHNVSVFSDNTLTFQRNNVWEAIQEAGDLMTAEQRAALDKQAYCPVYLIPPYFLYTEGNRTQRAQTTELNSQILDYCWTQKDKWGDLFPMVLLPKRCLGTEFQDEVVSIVRRHEFPGYCVWIDDFDERRVTHVEVEGLISLVRALSDGRRQVVVLRGGFFSLLLYHFGVTCVCHGLAYGEAQSVNAAAQQTSGPPPIRYYLLELHSFLSLENALTILRKRSDLICSCPVCQRIVRGDPENITRFADEESLVEMHFLYNRNQERRMIAGASLKECIQNLEWTKNLTDDIDKITRLYRVRDGYEERTIVKPTYIDEWKIALENAARAR